MDRYHNVWKSRTISSREELDIQASPDAYILLPFAGSVSEDYQC